MGRSVLSRKDVRDDYDAADRRQQDDADELERGDNEAEGETAEEEEAATDEEAGDEGEDHRVKRPRRTKAAAKPKPTARSRASKVARMKVVWAVFSNSNQRVATFDYPKRQDAESLAAQLSADQKTTHFVQPVKEPIEEKKET